MRTVTEDERAKMKAKGYKFVVTFPDGKPAPLYTKTMKQASELLRTDYKDKKGVKITPIDEDIMDENEIDFDAMTEDEQAELLDDFLIDELEEMVLEAIGTDANRYIAKLEEMQELLNAGEYEMGWDVAVSILEAAGARNIEEFKAGFKVASSQRAKSARIAARPKTGAKKQELKKRRKKAKKPAEKNKRARAAKKFKARRTRRRKQLGNSVEIDQDTVAEMLTAGFTHAVVDANDPDPTYTRDEETATELAEEIGGEVVTLDEYVPQNGARTKQAMASDIATFLKAHPDVTYGELGTRFKIGRDVAQQVMLSVGKFTSAYAGGSYSTGDLAKHIMGRLPQVGAVAASDDTTPAANLSEEDRESIETTLATLRKAGLMEEAELMESSIPGLVIDDDEDEDDYEDLFEVETDEDEEDDDVQLELDLDEEDEDDDDEEDEVTEARAEKLAKAKGAGQRGPKPRYQGQTGAIPDDVQHEDEDEEDDDDLVEVSALREQAEDLIEAAREAGLDSKATKIQVREGRIFMSVPGEAAAIINQRLSA